MTTDADHARVPIDKQTPDVYRAYVDVVRAIRRATKTVDLDRTLVELVNVRISQINGCASCLDVHVRDALAAGETTQRLAVLPAWRDTTLFTDKERAALTLAESITTLPDPRTQDQDYSQARRHLSPDELAAISWVAITINAFNRISIVSGHTPEPEASPSAATHRAPAAARSTR